MVALNTRLKEALDEQPRDSQKPAREVLGVAGISEEKMPVWFTGNDWQCATSPAEADVIPVRPLPPELKKEAAPLWVWWRDWVGPVLKALASDPAATRLVLEDLPAPVPFPKRKLSTFQGRKILIPDGTKPDIWKGKFCSQPVDLWLIWRHWNELTGLTTLPPAPDYHNAPKSPDAAFLFLSFLWTGFYADLRLNPARIRNRTHKALLWLQEAITQPKSAAEAATQARPENDPSLIYQADAAECYNIPKSVLCKAAKKKPGAPGYLWSGRDSKGKGKRKRVWFRKKDLLKIARSREGLGRAKTPSKKRALKPVAKVALRVSGKNNLEENQKAFLANYSEKDTSSKD